MSSNDDININLTKQQIQSIQDNLDENGKLTCIKAFKVAKLLKVEPIKMSAITKSLGIKITNCELGVFGKASFNEFNPKIYNNIIKNFGQTKITCKDLWVEAQNSSLKKVGSTVKNSDIDVVYCQLGCFREKKGRKNK